MKKQIATTIMAICLMSFTLASLPFYPGQTYNFTNEFNTTNLIYAIVGNSSIIPKLNISINITNITITFPGDMPEDNIKIVFLENKTIEVEKIIHTKGKRTTRTKYVDRNVTVYEPKFYDRNITIETEVEVEKIKTNTEYKDQPINYYYILFALVLGGVLTWALSRLFENEEEYEEEKYDYDEE